MHASFCYVNLSFLYSFTLYLLLTHLSYLGELMLMNMHEVPSVVPSTLPSSSVDVMCLYQHRFSSQPHKDYQTLMHSEVDLVHVPNTWLNTWLHILLFPFFLLFPCQHTSIYSNSISVSLLLTSLPGWFPSASSCIILYTSGKNTCACEEKHLVH